ncbi:MAG: tryptophan--tRNA ligase [Patescibacteria group bacterium]|nr:MAG: tryptophan--tRNA ligase [Patescibacteria group bacterium]
MKPNNRPTLFSAIKPSGNLHLGNYIGAISQWLNLQQDYRCLFCVVDYHAITVHQDPNVLRESILNIARIYLAAGIDPKDSVIFQQSDIKEHTELGWLLNTITKVSELEKMTQYKDKTKDQGKEGPGAGLLNYPTLMAADILLYNTEVVPVGEDQVQHIELTRLLARRFNTVYGETFVVPKSLIKETGARIMSLIDPSKKMSKSGNQNGCIGLNEDPLSAHKKIKRAITDSESRVIYNPQMKPAISNLLAIYSALSKKNIKELEALYENKSYGEFKEDLANLTADFLQNLQTRMSTYSDDDIKDILKAGAKKVLPLAEETMVKVKQAMGLN